MRPGTRSLSRPAILMAALVLAAPLPAAARGGGGGGHGGGGGFHAGGFGAMRGGGVPAFHGGFAARPGGHFSGVPGFRSHLPGFRFHEHGGLRFRLGSPIVPRSGRNFALSLHGAPPLRGNPVPPLVGGFRGPEIWRKGQNGVWHHQLGFRHRGRLSAGVLGFGFVTPLAGLPLVYAPYVEEAYGGTCNAGIHFCPVAPDAPIGTPCACPLQGGGLAQGWVE